MLLEFMVLALCFVVASSLYFVYALGVDNKTLVERIDSIEIFVENHVNEPILTQEQETSLVYAVIERRPTFTVIHGIFKTKEKAEEEFGYALFEREPHPYSLHPLKLDERASIR